MNIIKDENTTVAFINSHMPPVKIKRLGVYKYFKTEMPTCYRFQELVEKTYRVQETMDYTILSWEDVYIPSHLAIGVANVIEMNKLISNSVELEGVK